MATRILILTICFVAASVYIGKERTEPAVVRDTLSRFPMKIGEWSSRDLVLDDRVLSVLGLDDYLSRLYSSAAGPVELYVGFYQTQRQGNTIHSPLNCLPGSGWNPVHRSRITIPVATGQRTPDREIEINRITIEQGLERAVVLYWYQAHGRVVASEYWGRIYTVIDAMQMNRTDGAIVRVVRPIKGTGPEPEAEAEKEAVNFVLSIFPLLSRYLPE
jgi:EpsI family protein